MEGQSPIPVRAALIASARPMTALAMLPTSTRSPPDETNANPQASQYPWTAPGMGLRPLLWHLLHVLTGDSYLRSWLDATDGAIFLSY